MVLDDGKQKCQSYCKKPCKNCEKRKTDFLIYRNMCRTEDLLMNMNTEILETATNKTKDFFVLLNNKDVEIVSDEIGPELEQNTVSCSRCRHLLEHAQILLHKVLTVDKTVTLGICNHCRTKVQFRKSCNEYEEVVKKCETNKSDHIAESKERVKMWLSKVKHSPKDTLTDVEQSRSTRIQIRTYSDPYIDRLSKFSSRFTDPQPEIKHMFHHNMHRSVQARKYSQENMSTHKIKEQSKVPEICLKREPKRRLIFELNNSQSEDGRVKTSGVEKLTSGVRKYHSEEALHTAMSHEVIPRNYFSYCFPKPDVVQGPEHHLSSAELIKNTRDKLRYKTNKDKVKEEKVLEDTAYEQTKSSLGKINKEPEKNEIKLTKESLEQKTLAAGERKYSGKLDNQKLVMKNNKLISKIEENQLDNLKADVFTGEDKREFSRGKKQKVVDVDMKHLNDKERKYIERGTQKTKQFTRDEKNILFDKEKNIVPKPPKGETKNAGRETIKLSESEIRTKTNINKTTNVIEKTTLVEGKDKKRPVEEEKYTSLLENVKKKHVEEKKNRVEVRSKSEHKNLVKEVHTKFTQKDNKGRLTDQDRLNDKKTSKLTVINVVKTNGEPGVKSNIPTKKSSEKYFNKIGPDNNKVNVGKPKEKQMQDNSSEKGGKCAENRQQERDDELKRKREVTTGSKYKEKESINSKDNVVEEQIRKAENSKKLNNMVKNERELPSLNTRSITDNKGKDSAKMRSNTKERPDDDSKKQKNITPQLPAFKELRLDQIKVRRVSQADLSNLLKQGNIKQTSLKNPRSLTHITALQIKEHKLYKSRSWPSDIRVDSDFELDLENAVYKKDKPFELANIIIGQKLFKYKPSLKNKKTEFERIVKTKFEEDHMLIGPREVLDTTPEEVLSKPPLLHTKGTRSTDQEVPKGIVRYILSDRTFIDKGWTMLPTEKVVRKINVYRMRPVHPEFDWFEHNKKKRLMHYDTGEKLAEFDDNGRGRWYYRNGRLALDYYDAEEVNAKQRFVVYSSGEPNERGRSYPITILATFDYLGNGIVFDHSGKLRLKYNQTEGVVLDREIGPVSHWKWHSLNDPPVLQQVMIDTQIAHKVPEILKLGGTSDRKAHPDNEELLAIEFDNFINEKSKKLTQTFKPYQIKMKALKINEHFSLRVLDQTTIYLIFRHGSVNIKLNIGMLLDHKEILDTDTAEVGDVSNNLERFPARTDSLAGMQRSVAYAQHFEHCRMERERRLRPPVLCRSVDQLTAPISRPLRPPLRAVPSGSTTVAGECYCRLNRKPSLNLYCNTRFV